MNVLEPCPFCRAHSAAPACEGMAHFVTCGTCGARGPITATPEAAAESWNARPAGATKSEAPPSDKPDESRVPEPILLVVGDTGEPDKD